MKTYCIQNTHAGNYFQTYQEHKTDCAACFSSASIFQFYQLVGNLNAFCNNKDYVVIIFKYYLPDNLL